MTVELLGPEREDEVAGLVAHAFAQDPGYRWASGAEGERHARNVAALARATVGIHCAGRFPITAVVQEGALAAVALFEPPGASMPYVSGLRIALGLLARSGPAVTLRALRGVQVVEDLRPRETHVYLPVIAVDAWARGRGLARALLEDLHARCEAEASARGVALETANPMNVGLYEHLGYRVTRRVELDGRVPVWAMFRARRDGAPAAAAR